MRWESPGRDMGRTRPGGTATSRSTTGKRAANSCAPRFPRNRALARLSMAAADAGAMLRVADTTQALQDLAHWVRQRQPLRVLGITGSSGKTTTKEMSAAVMEEAMPTLKSTGNLNNSYGLPLCLLGVQPEHQAA